MDELDAELERRLAEAHERARTHGRNDVADYILLRAANDKLRGDAVAWLLETVTGIAGEANRRGASIGLERTEATHRFQIGNSTMVGTRLVLRVGIRTLTFEAGWPRAPRDGIMRGGGLASARATHFGDQAAGEEFLLVQNQSGKPIWFVLEKTGGRTELLEERLRRHVAKLLARE